MNKTLLLTLTLIAVGCGPEGPPSDGPFEEYYDNGQLLEKGTYAGGEVHGPYERYYENGQRREIGRYNMGARCGRWIGGYGQEMVTYDPCPPDLEGGS